MAFESQLAVQRGFASQRVSSEAFMLRVYETKMKGKEGQVMLSVRIPISIFKEAKFENKKLDIFYDHENHKVMIAPSPAGLSFNVQRDKSAYRDFIFAKGFTPDFGGGYVVANHEFTKHGDEKAVVFDYDPLQMVSGRNALKNGELPTRAQAFAAALLTREHKRLEEAKDTISALPKNAQPKGAVSEEGQSTAITVKPGEEGNRRSFSVEEKKGRVKAFVLQRQNHGKSFDDAARAVDIHPSVMRRWYVEFGKAVERELKRGASAEKNRNTNAAASVRHMAKTGGRTKKPSPRVVTH